MWYYKFYILLGTFGKHRLVIVGHEKNYEKRTISKQIEFLPWITQGNIFHL